MTAPLAVCIRNDDSEKHVTSDVTDMTFRSTIPGGFATCTIALYRPLSLDLTDINYYSDLIVYDGRSAETVWQGRVEDITRSDDGYQVTAVGPAAHTRDRTVPLIYEDRSLERFHLRSYGSKQAGDTGVSSSDNNVPLIEARAARDTVCGIDWLVGMEYRSIREAGQKVARFDYSVIRGKTDANWFAEAVLRVGTGGAIYRSDSFVTGTAGSSPKVVVTDFPNDGRDLLELRIHRETSSQTVADDVTYALFFNVEIEAMRYDAAGAEITTGYTGTVLASQVVEDLLGRLLNQYDGDTADVTATSFAIPQLAYPDGASPQQVLDDLMLIEPTYYWAAWEDTINGKARFEWTTWPTIPRYEVTAADGFHAPSSADDLYNRVRLRYRDINGRILSTVRTATVDALDAAGLTREHLTDLGDDVAALTTAQRVGDGFLAEHAAPVARGTVTVARPIFDRQARRYVEPWEIRPGSLVRVIDVAPTTGTLNSAADGVSVYKIRATQYDLASNSCRLDLDNGPNYVSSLLARLALKPQRRR